MNKRYRKAVVAANWKMNNGPEATKAFFLSLRSFLHDVNWCKVIVAPPFVSLPTAVKAARGCKVEIAAQNCYCEDSGAYTGEVSCAMLSELGVKYVIIGHSERRRIFGEGLELIRKKVEKALESGLHPILCVGETLDERQNGITGEVLLTQLKTALKNVTADDMRRIIIAYEPVWAIGTGNNATPLEANQACEHIRDWVREKYGARLARGVSILYGGSLNDKNASSLFSMPDIDGGLIGGASLIPDKFEKITKEANI